MGPVQEVADGDVVQDIIFQLENPGVGGHAGDPGAPVQDVVEEDCR
jgi:hypothetical protein